MLNELKRRTKLIGALMVVAAVTVAIAPVGSIRKNTVGSEKIQAAFEGLGRLEVERATQSDTGVLLMSSLWYRP